MKSICMPIIIKFHRLGSFPNVSGAAAAGKTQSTTYYPYGEPHRRPASSPGRSSDNRYLFGDKEYTDYDGESQLDFGARHLAPSVIPHFTTMDPLCEERAGESPYIFAAANPVMFTDPTGCIVEGDSLFIAYQVKLQNDYNLLKDDQKATKYVDFIKKQQSHINQLKESSQLYIINHDKNAKTGSTIYDSNRDAVIVNYIIKSITNPFENLSHELNHAWQFENGDLSIRYDGSAGLLYDIYDEVESYNVSNQIYHACLYYDHSSPKDANGNYYQITKKILQDPQGSYYYYYGKLPTKQRSLNKKTQKILQNLNSNGIVEYYINWKKDLQ